jgi:hypothetical protein
MSVDDDDLLVWNLDPLTGHFFSSARFDARWAIHRIPLAIGSTDDQQGHARAIS